MKRIARLQGALACIVGIDEILATGGKRGSVPELWDGHAAERIADDMKQWFACGLRKPELVPA